MPSTTITISTEAHARLKKFKRLGQSFSEVITENLVAPADTCGELLDRIERMPPPKFDETLMERVMKDRKRRSKR